MTTNKAQPMSPNANRTLLSRSGRWAALPLLGGLALFCGACTGFSPSPPPAAQLSFSLDLPASQTAQVVVYDESDQRVGGAAAVKGGAQTTLTLTPQRSFGVLRLSATAGERVLKATAAGVGQDGTLELGKVDAASTAAAQLLHRKVAGDGGTFGAMPQSVISDLLQQIKAERAKKGSAVADFFALVGTILAQAKPEAKNGAACFDPLSAALSAAFVSAHQKALPDGVAAAYTNKLSAASDRLSVNLVCDAALVKVMFTVDVSGEALDGNGTKQLVRQPVKGDKVYLAITVDESSEVADAAGLLKTTMTPNDPATAMVDDGTAGDEKAGDGVYTKVMVLPRGMRIKYKYTNGSAGEGWTRTEEWPGNARLLEVRDVLSRHADGTRDCLVVRRDSFGDEATNKNFVNLHSVIKNAGGTLSFDKDLGGSQAAEVTSGRYYGGLALGDVRKRAPLTPKGLPEALENGICSRCPAPLTLSTDDDTPPKLIGAEFISTDQIKVSFSEALEYATASSAGNYLVVDAADRALAISAVAASGSTVTLTVGAPDFGQTYTLHVKNLRDASAKANAMPRVGSNVQVKADRTSPQVVSATGLPLRDFNPGISGVDPTVGGVVKLTFNEELDPKSAENAGNYRIEALAGADLRVKSAYLRGKKQVWLVTETQGKRKPYDLLVQGVRDLAGNLVKAAEPVRFSGFALYQVTFGAVPGFAFLTLDGKQRGLPSGAKLYLTGTVLSVARDLSGNPISVAGRTDVTGVPEFEMKPSSQVYKGKPVYTITLLAPPGTYAWKVAHGVAGEYKNPPATLVKVHKSLATTMDSTAVNIDPATLTALPLPGADGKPVSFLDYGAAVLSKSGGDAPGPFVAQSGATLPAPKIMFKRENPDEVCAVTKGNTVCPPIVIGTWRDIAAFSDSSGKTNDYDDGLSDVPPLRVQKDVYPPTLQHLQVRDSQSLLLTFDERLSVNAQTLSLGAVDAESGAALPLSLHTAGSIGGALLPHQMLVCVGQAKGGKCDGKMRDGASYALSYRGLADVYGNIPSGPLSQNFSAPGSFKAFTPLADNTPPDVIGVRPKSPTGLIVQFSEKVVPADAQNSGNYLIKAASGTAPKVVTATLQGGGTAVHLTTGTQAQQASYKLVVSNIRDLASPPNQLKEKTVDFKGFGDSAPPRLVYATALSANEVVLGFDEPLAATSAAAASSYRISGGVSVAAVTFAGSSTLKAAAFDQTGATFADSVVTLAVSGAKVGQSYTVTPSGVTDLSGNTCANTGSFTAVSAPAKVDVIITYTVSDTLTSAGKVPGKAISLSTMKAEREGMFILGSTLSLDGKTKGDPASDPVTRQLGGFPAVGQPLNGAEPQLRDDGNGDDKTAGDGVYTLRIKDVPLGTSLQWKAFASYKTTSSAPEAQFADGTPGPSAYQDGQEYPGNENGVRILGDKNGDGVVWLQNLFGDETTYKKFTDSPAFVWVVDDVTWTP